MTRNNILNFIIESIQWGKKIEGDEFYSENALAIKFNTSHSTAKNALNIAEGMGLLSSQKGKKRTVLDFKRNVFISKYFNKEEKYGKFNVKRIDKNNINKYDKKIFEKNFSYKNENQMVVVISDSENIIGKFYSSTSHKEFYKTLFSDSLNFLQFLEKTKLIINRIDKKTYFGDDGNIWTKRYLFDQKNEIIEEGLLIIKPKNYYRERSMKFYYKN